MHYYQHHIGDYAFATSHLSIEEDCAYRRMLDLYYDTEAPIPNDPAFVAKRIRMLSHVETVKALLNEFFILQDDGWHSSRADAEISAYKRMQDGGRNGANKRWSKAGDSHPIATPSLPLSTPQANPNSNHKPITNNQEPITPKSPKGYRTQAVSLKTFLDSCKQKNEKPISGYTPVFSYAESVGLPTDFIQLAWFEFCRQFGDGGVNESRKQKDWRKTFRNYVEKGYLKLWWITPEGRYELTTNGKQAQLANSERLAA